MDLFYHVHLSIPIFQDYFGVNARPPPPLRGRRDRMRVPKISGKGVLFVRQSPARELKKGGYLTFHYLEISLKRGWFFFLSLFGRLRNLKRGLK